MWSIPKMKGVFEIFTVNYFSSFLEAVLVLGRREAFSLCVSVFMMLLLWKREKNRMCPT